MSAEAHDSAFPPLGEETPSELETRRFLLKKEVVASSKGLQCGVCWKPRVRCLCGALKNLRDRRKQYSSLPRKLGLKVFNYVSREEWRCGGNSGRLLSLLFGTEVTYYVHGSRYDAARLRNAVASCNSCCVLFPGAAATTVERWSSEATSLHREYESNPPLPEAAERQQEERFDAVILVDGTWDQARRMEKRLRLALLPLVPQVALDLEGDTGKSISVFHRSQSQPGRICTAEALALFVGEVYRARRHASREKGLPAAVVGGSITLPDSPSGDEGSSVEQQQGVTAATSSSEQTSNSAEATEGCTTEEGTIGLRETLERLSLTGEGLSSVESLETSDTITDELLSLVRDGIVLNTQALHPVELSSLWKGSGGDPIWYYGERVVNGVNELNYRRNYEKGKHAWSIGAKREARGVQPTPAKPEGP